MFFMDDRRAAVVSHIPIDPPLVSIKDVLTKAKSDRGYINEARERALLYMSHVKTIKEAMAVISILNLSGDLKNSINVIDQLYKANIEVDTKVFNNVLNGCAKSNDWKLALDLIKRMSINNIKMDAITFGTAISACKGGQWQLSLKLLDDMDKYGVEADTICYSSVVSCLSRHGRWQESLGLMQRMRSKNINIDLITYNTVIYSCSVQMACSRELKLILLLTRVQFTSPSLLTRVQFTTQ
jgi:pentatricopeptide repeat protein